jgi:hypothetical protein
MKATASANFSPEEVRTIQNAYALALKTLEATGPLSKIQRDGLAKEVINLAKSGCWETKRLASRAIMRASPDVTVCLEADMSSSLAGFHLAARRIWSSAAGAERRGPPDRRAVWTRRPTLDGRKHNRRRP